MIVLNKISYNSPVILSFTVISGLVLILSILTDGNVNKLFFSVYPFDLKNMLGYVRMFTHILGHSSIEHYVGNFMFILLLGPILEEKYGSKNIFKMIVITAFITGLFSIAFFDVRLQGASGIVFMFILLVSVVNIERGKIPLTFILVVVFYLGEEIFNGLVKVDDIAQYTHIVGGICGAYFGYLLGRRK